MSETAAGETQDTSEAGKADKKVLVWDLPTRLFHWLLVLSLAGSWWTMEYGADFNFDYVWWHFMLGYFAAGLIIFRIIWGFIGPRHARFGNFLKAPGAVAAYVGTLFRRDSKPHVGHNPLGGIMVVVILAAIAFQVGTGLFATDDIFSTGPFYAAVDSDTADWLTGLHHDNVNILLALAGLHVAAILFYWIWKGQQLIGPMITGRKERAVAGGKGIASSRFWLGLLVAALAAAMVYGGIQMAPEPADEDFEEFY